MKKLKIGITGSTGSLGKELISQNKCKFVKFKGNICFKKQVKAWFRKNQFDAIIHLAAIVPIKKVNENKKKALEVNFKGTKYIVDEILRYKINWLFFSSTSHVYSSSKKKISEKFKLKPISYYGKTKKMAENYISKKLRNTNIRYCIGRIFSTTNKNQKRNYLVPDLKNKIKNSKKQIFLENLNHYRDFISMEDISKIIYLLLKNKYQGTINLGTGNPTYLKDIAKKISKKYKKKIYFIDNKKATYLVADIKNLKKIYKKNLVTKLERLIF